MHTPFSDLLARPPIVADGAMGTMLLDAGLRLGEAAELWNVLPEKQATVRAIHEAYQDAGAQIVLTNSLGGNLFRLRRVGLEHRLYDINRAAAALAREAVGTSALVAGSIGPTGEPLTSYEAAEDAFATQASALAAGGVDMLWIETMGDPLEARAAVLGARQANSSLPTVVTFSFTNEGSTYTGATPTEITVALRDLDLAAVGANCGDGPAATERAIVELQRAFPGLPLVAKSNLGIPTLREGRAAYDVSPAHFAAHARRVHALGATIIGGCCGSTPQYIRAISTTE